MKLGLTLQDLGKPQESKAEHKAARSIQEALVKEFPRATAYHVDLGGSYCNYGDLILDEGKPAESLEWYDLAIQTLQPVHEKAPRDPTAKHFLRQSYWARAQAYNQLQKPAEAVKDWGRAIDLSPPDERPQFRASRAISKIQAGMVVEAVVEVSELTIPVVDATGSPKWNADQWYNFACIYAIASGKIADKEQEYADRAMELLHKAVQAGFKDAAHMKKDTDLDPLRERDDFKKLYAELEAGAKQRHP